MLTDEGITYIADSRDTVIPMMMYHTGENWAKEEIDFFFKSTSGDYCKATGGIFIDIGANIGTTSIYVKEKVPGLKVIGFEPGRENFDLFRANIIMNRMDGVTAEWMGLSDENGGRIIAIFRLIQEEVIYRRVRQLRRMT
ncbi:MAG: FkbM family methyltransferase [Lachnospiraceae bacterium]|nr:FkbM family methyltransferase [Lachnospiraceae bacterium]